MTDTYPVGPPGNPTPPTPPPPPRTRSSDDEITESDLRTALRVLRVLNERHWMLISEVAAGHINNTVAVLEVLGPLVVRLDPSTQSEHTPCPCELADLAKKSSRR